MFLLNVLPGNVSLFDPDFEVEVGGDVKQVVPLDITSTSFADLEGMQKRVQVASMPVTTKAERDNFRNMRWRHTGYRNRSMNWNRSALDWNALVKQIEAGEFEVKSIFRKTVAHLEKHWQQGVTAKRILRYRCLAWSWSDVLPTTVFVRQAAFQH